MKYNNLVTSTIILFIILGVFTVGGIAYFTGKSSAPKNEAVDNSNYYPVVQQNQNPSVANNNPPTQTPQPNNNSQQQQTPPPQQVGCASSTTPSITVLSPNGGEIYSNTAAVKVKWKSCNIASSETLAVELLYGTDSIMVDFVPNTGSHTFQLSPTALMNPAVSPSQPITYGKQFKVHVGTAPTTSPSYHDWSDNLFTINGTVSTQNHCGLTINSPTANSKVSFPLTVTGTVNNNNSSTLGCSWTMFEGQAGTAHLYRWNNGWQSVGNDIVLPVSNWMTTGPVSFSIAIPNAGLSSGTNLKITFTEENPSDNPPVDTLDLFLSVQ